MALFTPHSLIAGQYPLAQGRADGAVSVAATLLGVSNVAMVYTCHQDSVWYIAAPAADFSSMSAATTSLASALPGNEGHQGDGAYLLEMSGGLECVIVKKPHGLTSYIGPPEYVQRFIRQEGSPPVYACAGEGKPWCFPKGELLKQEAKLLLRLTVAGICVSVIASCTWLWLAYMNAQRGDPQQYLTERLSYLQQQEAQLLQTRGYPKALQHLQGAVQQTIREKGVLRQFEFRDGRSAWILNVGDREQTGHAE